MRGFKVFLKFKNIFNRLNPINTFDFGEIKEDIEKAPDSKKLLEKTIKKYPHFDKIILMGLYHLINTQNVDKEFLSVLSKDLNIIADLLEGNDEIVEVPYNVKLEGKKNNILVACHNHFFGAIIPSLSDICTAIKYNCRFIVIVSDNSIGIIVNDFNLSFKKDFIEDYIFFNGYIQLCVDFEKSNELDQLDSMNLNSNERKKLENEIFDRFVGENTEKFVDEFNLRFNKYNIYEIYINI
ncbi:hypothetical protein [Methanobrevibacter sp.]